MLPVTLDLSRLGVILAGNGEAACRRLALLDEAGAAALAIHAPDPVPALAMRAGHRLVRRWPRAAEIARARLVFLAGVPCGAAAPIRAATRRSGALVNIEDDAVQSDFHSASVLRRGDLTVAVSTNGASPGLAAAVRRALEPLFGPEWEARAGEIAALRRAWRSAGADPMAIGRWTRAWFERCGWRAAAASDASLARRHPLP